MSEVLQHRADAEKKSLETVEDLLHSGDFEELTRLVQQENWSTNERKQLLILIVTVVSPSIDPKNYSKTIAALFQSTVEDFNTPTSRDNDASLMKSNLQKSDDFALNIIKLALLMEACGQVYYSLKFVDYCLSSIPEAYFVSEDVSQVALATRSDLTEISGTEEERAMLHFIAMQELFVHLSVFCRLFSKELIDVSTSLFDWILLSKKQKVIYHLQLLFSRVKSEDRLTQSLGQLLQKELFEMFDSDLPLNSFLSKNLFLQVLREAEAIGVSQGPSEGFALLTEHRALAQDEEEEDTEHVILQAISDLCPSLNHEQICAILRVIEERFATVTGNEEVEEEVEGEVTSAPSLHFSEEFYVKLLLLVITRIDQMDPILSLLRSILSLIFSQVTRPLSELLLLCLYELERISVVVAALSGRLTVPPLAVLAPQWIKEAIQHLNLQDTQRHFNLRRCLMTQAMFKENHFKQTRDLIDVMSRSMRLHRFLDLLSVSEGEQYLSGEEEEEGGAALSCYDYSIEEILLFSLSRATVKLSESDKEKDESVETISTKAEQLVIGYLRNVYELFSANERTVRLEQVRYAVFEVLRRILPDALWKEIVSLGLFGRPTGSSSTSSSDCKIFEWMEKLFPDLSNIHFAVFVASAFFCGKELYSSGGVSLEQPIYYLNLLRIANFENNDDVAATANLKAFLHIEFYAHNLKQTVSEQLSPSLYDCLFSEVFKREREASSSSLVRQEGWLEKYFDDFVKRLEEISCDVANIAQAKNLFQLIVSSSSSDEEDSFDVESQYSFPGFNFFQSFLAVYHRRLLNDSLEDPRHSFSRKTTLLDEMLSDLARFSGRFVLVLFRIASHLREFRVCLDLCDYFFRHSALFTTVKVETAMIEEIFRFRDLICDNYHYSGDALSLTQRCLCSLSDDRMMKYFDKLLLHPRQSTISGSDGEDIGSRAARILDKLVTSGQGSAIDSILDLGFRQNLEEDETHLTLVALMQLASKAKESSHRRAFESLSTGIRHALDSQSNKVKEELAGVRSVLNVSVHFQNELEIDQINETYVNKLVKSGFSVSGAKKAVYETRKVGTFEAALQFAITHNQDEGFDNPIVLGEKKNEGLILSSSRSRTLESLQKQERLNRMLSMIRRISERLFPSDSKTFMELPVISIAETSLPFVKEENQEIRRSARLKSVLQEDVDEEQSNMPCTASISFEGVTHDALEEDKNGGNHTIDEITRSRSASIEDKAANRDSDVEEISGESSRRSETDMLDSSNVATAPDTPNLPISVEVGNELISHQSVRDVLSPKLRGLHQQLALSVELQAFLDHFFVLGDDGRTLFAVENFHILINKVIHSTSDEASFFNLIDDALPFIIEFFESNKSCDDIERLAELLLKEKEVDSFISSLTRLRDEVALLFRDFLCFLEADETRKLDEDKLLSKRERIISICFLSRWVFLVRNEEANLLHHFTADFQLRFFRRFPFLYSQLLSLHYETIRATDYVSILWVKERLADLIEVSGLWEVFLHSVFPQLLQLLHPSVIATSLLESAALLDLWQTLLQEECQVLKRLEKIYGAAISGSNDIGMVFNAKAFIQSETFLPPRYFPLQSNRAASNKEFLSRRKFTGLREIFYQMPSEETALLSLLPQIHRYFSKYLSLQSVSDLFFLAILRQLDHRINHDSDEEDTFSFFDDSLLEKLSTVHVRILSYLIADWPLEKLHLYDQTIEQGAVITSPSFEEEPTSPVSQLLCLPHCDQIRRKFHEHITYASKRQLLLRLEQHSIRHSSQQTKSKIKKIGAATPAFDVSTDSGHESFISHLLIPFCRILEEVENLSQPKEVLLDFFATSFDAIPSSKEKCGAIFLWPHCDSDELRALKRRFLPRFKGGSDEAVILDDVRSVEVLSSFYRWFFAFQDDLCRSVATLSPTTGLEELVLTLSRDSFDELLTSFHGCDDAEQRENCGENFARFMLVLSRGKSFVRSSNNPAKSSFDELIVEFLEAIWKETICKCPLTSHSVAGRLIPGMDGSNSESEGMLSQSEFFYLLNRKFLYFAWDTVAEQSVIRTIGAALDDFHYLIRLLQLAHISFFKKFLSINYDGSGESSQWRVQWQDSDSSSELLLSTEAFILHLVTCTVSNSSLHGHSAEFYHWLLIYMRKLLVSSSFHPSSPINSTVQHYASTSLRLQLLRFFYDVEVSPLLTDLLRSDSLETVKSSWLSFLQILLKNCQWSVLSDALSVDFPLLFKIQKESSSDALYQRSQELLSDILKSDDMTSSSKMNDDSSVEITRLLALWLSSLTGASEELVGRLEDIALRIEGSDDVGKLQVLSYHLFPTYVHTLIPRLLILSEPKEGRNVLFRLLLRHSFPVIDAFPSGPLLKIQQQSGNNQESLDERLQNAEGSKLWPEPLDLVCVILLQGYALEAVYLNWFLQRLPKVSFSQSQGALLLRQGVARNKQLILSLECDLNSSSAEKLLSSERRRLFDRALDCLRQFN